MLFWPKCPKLKQIHEPSCGDDDQSTCRSGVFGEIHAVVQRLLIIAPFGCRIWCLAVGLVLFQVSGREEVSLCLGWHFRKSWNDPFGVFIAGVITKLRNS